MRAWERSHASEQKRKTAVNKKQACFLQSSSSARRKIVENSAKEGGFFSIMPSYTDMCLAYKAYSDFGVCKLSTPGAEPTASTLASDSGFRIVVVVSAIKFFSFVFENQ